MPQTKQAISLNKRKYYQKNKEKILLQRKENYKKFPEKYCYKPDIHLKYRQTEKGKKSRRINDWRRSGIKDEDLSAVYDYYIKQTNCMICLKEYVDSYDRCLDHDHQTGEIRYIVCRGCNSNFMAEKYIS